MTSILIANRGEIAIRVAEAAAELGMESVAIHPRDDARCLHVRRADRAVEIPGTGAAAYLDIDAVVDAARRAGCALIHPGYGFLSENAAFARAVEAEGMTFIGPSAEVLEKLGDKPAALALARELGVPVGRGLDHVKDAGAARAFMEDIGGPAVLKAVAGGGGRGMRLVSDPGEMADAFASASREAEAAFGNGALLIEQAVLNARHVEVQVLGDGSDVIHLWDRDCTLQRRHQKLVEIAPAPAMDPAHRQVMLEAALKMARAVCYRSAGTFEFLVGADGPLFIEANPRLQVEHTVTEEITGVDLVAAQIRIALGAGLADLGLASPPRSRGAAVQARVNMERMAPGGETVPASGSVTLYELPGGPGLRVDGHGFAGMETSPHYDSLLAKVIAVSEQGHAAALRRLGRALDSFQVEGVDTNLGLLGALVAREEVAEGGTHTRFVDAHLEELGGAVPEAAQDAGTVTAPLQGTLLHYAVAEGESVKRGAVIAVLEAMKMQHSLRAGAAGTVRRLTARAGETVDPGTVLAVIDVASGDAADETVDDTVDLDRIRKDLSELQARKALLQDEARPDAMARRRAKGKQTARENVAQLVDEGSFVEMGDLAFAAQRSRRSVEDLMKNTPADGLITGFGTVNASEFGAEASRTAVMAYDYTVLAGTQGLMNHAKTDRMIEVIARQRVPVVFYCEGGGGRPGDVDAAATSVAGLFCTTFEHYAGLSGLVPLVGIASGRLFAGNAALLGCSDVVIATRDATIGMGGPAMIEGGGLGVFRAEEVGPTDVQAPNGVIDLLVEDEAEATAAAKRYLSYFQGPVADWTAPDPRRLRHVIPENRLQVYDVHDAIAALADEGSVMELRSDFAPGMVTALIRVEGRAMGLIANNPLHLSGAIDSPAADKAARFMKLCDAFDLPLVSLVDTPGMMVGPEVEKTALVRHCSRLFVAGAGFDGPMVSIILRKAYGLGAMAMMGGSTRRPLFCVGWPTAEIGAMGLEGAVRLGYRKELEAVADPAERQALFEKMVAQSYERGKGVNAASVLEFDTVIDPAETRHWIASAMDASPPRHWRDRADRKRAYVDTW